MNSSSQIYQNENNRNGYIITIILLIAYAVVAMLFAYFGIKQNVPQLFILSIVLAVGVVISIFILQLIRAGRTTLGMLLASVILIINATILTLTIQDLEIIVAVPVTLILLMTVGFALPNRYSIVGTVIALGFGVANFAAAFFLDYQRINIPLFNLYARYIALIAILALFIVFAHGYKHLSLQNKITLGIMITSGVAVAIITIFGLQRARDIVTSISDKYESSVTSETESQILSRVQTEASVINQTFASIVEDATELAEYHSSLEIQQGIFTTGSYWNSSERLFLFSGGQTGNASTDVSSVFIPSTVSITEEMLADMNTSVYLDFLAPTFLQAHPDAVAVYFISASGYTIYYPNIVLAGNVPADFDPRGDSFYTIATPERNPEKLPRWTDPYQDPAGTGLIVTLSIPVYSEANEFKGVIGVDVQMQRFSDAILDIRLGETDFAFLVDQDGFIISMPDEGYELFDLKPQETPITPLNRRSIFDTQSQTLQFAAQRIIINQANLIDFPINDIQTYLAVAVLPATNYKLVIFAPTDELNAEIVASRQEVQNEVNESVESAVYILIGLFVSALVISLLVGQIITSPVKRLTRTVQAIAGGDLTARADVTSRDEAGILARSFNSMAQTLNETLTGLEERVAERTQEVEKISENNAYRASQFESIARISKITSSTQTLDRLLPQIVQTISEEFDFYHVGIFLLDVHKEFAVLAAANSEGGKRMLERSHRLRVGETGLVGYVTRSGQPRVALDVGADAVFFNNPDLPETRSEIALPIRVGADIFGALDVQSVKTNAFSEEDVNILSVLADQVSIAIQNARSYQQSRESLAQAELAAAQMIEQQWSQFLGKQDVTQYHFDGIEASQAIKKNEKQTQNLAIPLILRGAKIGTLKLSTADPNRIWDEDEIAIAQATAERTALAIENARLLSEAQKRATKERTIGKVSSKIGNSISLENILKTTIQELGNTLPGADIAIQFTPDSPEQH